MMIIQQQFFMLQADSSIIKIGQFANEEVSSQSYNFEDSSLGENEVKPSSKMIQHQKDRFGNKQVGKGFFNNEDDNDLIKSTKPQQAQQKRTKKDLSKRQVDYYSSKVRIGRDIILPTIKRLRRADSIGLAVEEELARVQKNSQQLLGSQDLRWKITRFTPQEVGNMGDFIKSNISSFKTLSVLLRRNRGGFKRFFPLFTFEFFQEKAFIMKSKRMSCNATSVFCLSAEDEQKQNDDFMGIVQSNFLGSTYNLYDSVDKKKIIATIFYSANITFTQEPINVEVYIVSPYYSYDQLEGINEDKNLKQLFDVGGNGQKKKILKLVNKKPVYNQRKKKYELNFHGKMKITSVKNIILVDSTNEKKQAMLVAKNEEDQFYLDINHPLSPRIAMAIINSLFDFKWISQ